MKTSINLILLILVFSLSGYSQDNKQNPVAQAIEAKEYVFKARSVLPATGGTRQLTSQYDFTINHDSAIAYLPYFGRAYVATIGKTGDGGINFTSTDFSYTVTEEKKGGWTIQIKPKDAGDVQQVTLNISKNGYGTLHVNSQNRQAISFTGKVDPIKTKS
jgi:hypothetical protein